MHGLELEVPGFGGGSSNLSRPSRFAWWPQNFGNCPGTLDGTPTFGSGPLCLGSAPRDLSRPPAFGSDPGPIHIGGPHGFVSSFGKLGPTVIKVENMVFTVSIDEILDYFMANKLSQAQCA